MNPKNILARIAGLTTNDPGTAAVGAFCSMQVPGTTLYVPVMQGTGPVSTWRIAREGADSGVTIGDLEAATASSGRFVGELSWPIGGSDVHASAWGDTAAEALTALGQALEDSWPRAGSLDSLELAAPKPTAPLPCAIVTWQVPDREFCCEIRILGGDWLAELRDVLAGRPEGVAEQLLREHDTAGRPEFCEWITELASAFGIATVTYAELYLRENQAR